MVLHFILVEPIVPENVGGSARAIKTMGFDKLILINSDLHQQEKAKWLAYGANDILDNAKVFPSLKDAIQKMDFVIGTTAKHRTVKHNYHPGPELKKFLHNKEESIHNVAIVFGREDNGLRNEELDLCDIISGIPLHAPYPSLNLSQAVMLYAWFLSSCSGAEAIDAFGQNDFDECPPAGVSELKGKIASLFEQTGNSSDSRFYKKLVERIVLLKRRDINLLHYLCEMLLGNKRVL
ncbi:MAG: tRNA/rRNA methyltransferase [Fibrobacteria bacterium]|nr:tRNA/rRNA methyltransferase [Fibrobacteria bacterium]